MYVRQAGKGDRDSVAVQPGRNHNTEFVRGLGVA